MAFIQFLSTFLVCLTLVTAQTYTLCNPLKKTCPPNLGLASKSLNTDFTSGRSSDWNVINASTISYNTNGVAFTVNAKNDSPTLGTNYYFLFGKVEVKMRASPGTGIVSAIVLESDDLDEIDWEILGGAPNSVQTNFFGKGDTTTYNRGQTHAVAASTTTFHTYTIDWTSSAVTWSIDGKVVRTLSSTDASTAGGKNFPQTPCQLRIGNWAAGASPNPGTVSWAGGPTDFSKAPFSMYVSSVNIVNYNPASSYTYSDSSGSWQSIKITGGASVAGKAGSGTAANSTTTSATASSTTVTSSKLASSTTLSASSTVILTSSMATTSAATSSSASASASARTTNVGVSQTASIVNSVTLSCLVFIIYSIFWV